MNNKSALFYFLRAIVFVLLLISMTMSMTPASAGQATQTTQLETRRADMMAIAERYVNYRWTAINSAWGSGQPTNEKHGSHVDTPDVNWCASHLPSTFGCWSNASAPAENVGVPYFWGGSTAVEDDPNDGIPDLYLNPHDKFYPAGGLPPVGYFGQKIAAGAPAGDVGTLDDPAWSYANGVDCIGFVGQVWRTGTRLNMPTAIQQMRPIRFQDLHPGDVLQRYLSGSTINHVVLFKNWVNYDPASGTPPIGTRFQVYEASLKPNKVVISEYELTGFIAANVTKSFRGKGYLTDQVKIKRNQFCDPNGCRTDGIYEDENYFPYTYLTPMDIVLVVDRSPSIGLDSVKTLARMFVNRMRPGDKVAIVPFSGDVQEPIFPLTEIDAYNEETGGTSAVKTAAKNYINGITVSGGTSIGAGLLRAQQELDSSENPVQLMILLTDGEENTAPLWKDIAILITDPVYSLGLGTWRDYILLSGIASRTGGSARYSYINGVDHLFNSLSSEVYGENVVQTGSGTVPASATVEQTVSVDPTMGSVVFELSWPVGDLDLTLVSPDGQIIDPGVAQTDPNISFTPDSNHEFYTIPAPQPGQWILRISGVAVSGPETEYNISVRTFSSMDVTFSTDKTEYRTGESIRISAFVEDASLTDPLGAENVRGTTMQISVEDPNPQADPPSFMLFDDGLHEDGAANDGVYANTFSSTSLKGAYDFNVQISGNTNRDAEPFTRADSLSVLVTDFPTVVSVVRASVNPTNYYNYTDLDYKVTFPEYEYVNGVDVSDFALTTEGVSGATVKSVSQGDYNTTTHLHTYTVTVNTGTGNGTIRLDVIDDDTIRDTDHAYLGGIGLGNGNFTTGEVYTIDKTTRSTIVTKLADTNDGLCDSDCSLREAIGASLPGETITLVPALSGGTIRLSSTLTLSKNLIIDGSALAIPITISGDTNNDGLGDVQIFNINPGLIVTLKGLTVAKGNGNPSGGEGGAVHNNNSNLTVIDSTFNSNNATRGGAINSEFGSLAIINSTFVGNSGAWGGAIYQPGINNTVTISNSTFYGNTVTSEGGALRTSGPLILVNSTFSGNSANAGGAVYSSFSNLYYSNTIIANSISGGDCVKSGGAIGTNVRNLVEDGSCSAALSGDPNLGALADNGGRTQTMALLSGSPAIDAGDDAVCAAAPVNNLDQRGNARPQGPHCDIGAFELGGVHTGFLSRVSISTEGMEANQNNDLTPFSISADGRYIAFISYADNLVNGDTNGGSDIFLRDTQTNTTTRISIATDGTQANGQSIAPTISADGRYVAFSSDASNLVSGDTNGTRDIFLRDTQTNATTRISIATDGTQANGFSTYPSISVDGRYVAFQSFASNLVSGDTNLRIDIFLRDTQTNTTTRISVATDGTQGDGQSVAPSISADGRYTAFQSFASNLVSGDTNSNSDIFLRDTQTNTTTRISIATDGTQGNSEAYEPYISADGRYVAFSSDASNLVSGDTNNNSDILLRDTQTNTTTRLSVATDGMAGNGDFRLFIHFRGWAVCHILIVRG